MEEIFLDVELREGSGRAKAKALRGEGFIPAVIYGEGKSSCPIRVSHKQLFQLLHQHRLENVVINLKVKTAKSEKKHSCLIKEIQYDPVKGDIIHVDFNEISLTKAIKVNVPLAAKGEAAGVKTEGGSLEHILWEIEVECLPTEIPKDIEVDVSNLKIGDSIYVKDIAFPSNIKVLTPLESVAISCAAPKEEVAVPVEGEEPQEPEVIKEKKPTAEEGAEEAKKETKETKEKK